MARALFMQQPMKKINNKNSEKKYSQIDIKVKKLSDRNSEKFLHGDFVKDYLFNEWQYEIKETILSNNDNSKGSQKDSYNCKKNRIFQKYNLTTTDFNILNKNKNTDCNNKISMSKED